MNVDAAIEENTGLIISVANRFSTLIERIGKEEVFQAGTIALAKASANFDPTRGIQFSTYATRAIVNTLVHLDRRTRRRPTCELNDQTEPTCDPFGEREEQEQREQHAKTCGRIVRDLMNGLKPRYARALELRAEGKSLKEIAAEFGVTPERARQIVFKAITTVKRSKDLKAFEDEYDASLQALE